jgi:hypothetical protein
MFEPDVLLFEQFFILRRKPLPAEKRLLLAMLEDAVHCFQTYLLAITPEERQLFREAEEWINSKDDSRWFFSFENTCEILDLDPDCVRNALKRWKVERLRSHGQQGKQAKVAAHEETYPRVQDREEDKTIWSREDMQKRSCA